MKVRINGYGQGDGGRKEERRRGRGREEMKREVTEVSRGLVVHYDFFTSRNSSWLVKNSLCLLPFMASLTMLALATWSSSTSLLARLEVECLHLITR